MPYSVHIKNQISLLHDVWPHWSRHTNRERHLKRCTQQAACPEEVLQWCVDLNLHISKNLALNLELCGLSIPTLNAVHADHILAIAFNSKKHHAR
jgi:hypothetical protein